MTTVQTGEIVSIPGIYQCTSCGAQRTFPQGHKVPPCSEGNCYNTTFRLVRKTNY